MFTTDEQNALNFSENEHVSFVSYLKIVLASMTPRKDLKLQLIALLNL
jgi:hypothetical protein